MPCIHREVCREIIPGFKEPQCELCELYEPERQTSTQKGWECPKCGWVMAPYKDHCVFCARGEFDIKFVNADSTGYFTPVATNFRNNSDT